MIGEAFDVILLDLVDSQLRFLSNTASLADAHRWMQVQSHCRVCPVCKAGIDDEKVGKTPLHA